MNPAYLTRFQQTRFRKIRKARELVGKYPEKYFMPDQFSNEFNKLAHYRTTAEEILGELGGSLDYFVSSIGTSGTIVVIFPDRGEKYLSTDLFRVGKR